MWGSTISSSLWYINFSKTLLIQYNKTTGRYLTTLSLAPSLCSGLMQEIFQLEKNLPVSFGFLKVKDSDLANLSAQPRRKTLGMPSRSVVLVMSRALSITHTSSGLVSKSHTIECWRFSVSQVPLWLYTGMKYSLNMFAFSSSLLAFWSFNFFKSDRMCASLTRFRYLKIFSVERPAKRSS